MLHFTLQKVYKNAYLSFQNKQETQVIQVHYDIYHMKIYCLHLHHHAVIFHIVLIKYKADVKYTEKYAYFLKIFS